MAEKKHFKMRFSLWYEWNNEIFAKNPDEAKAIAKKEIEEAMLRAGSVEFLQSSAEFVEDYEGKVGKVAELAQKIQKEQSEVQIKRLVRLAVSKSGADEIGVRWAIDKLVQMELLRCVKPGIVKWVD